MTKIEALGIIHKENLSGYNLNETRPHMQNEVGIQYQNRKWIVYTTTERASLMPGSEEIYSSESDALNDFIDRLRASKELEQLTEGKYH